MGPRTAGVWALAAAVAACGCDATGLRNPHEHGGAMVDEVRPAWPATERPAAASAVMVLWRWQAVPLLSGAGPTTELLAATRPATPGRRRRERAIEVQQVFVRRGQSVGFRRRADGQLIAVAGPTTRPLDAGHYCWHLLRGNPTVDGGPGPTGVREPNRKVDALLTAGVVVAAVAGLVALPFVIDHFDRHAHLVRSIDRALGDDAAGGD